MTLDAGILRMSDFEGQFIISDGRFEPAEQAVRWRLSTICVDVFDSLDVVEVFDGSWARIGLFLGNPVDTDQRAVIRSAWQIAADPDKVADIDQILEIWVYRLSGSFIFVLDGFGCRRVYLDANGTKSLVFDSFRQVAAASTALVSGDPGDYHRRFRRDLYNGLQITQDGWFPAGLTAYEGVSRLMCNHYLDLESWSAVRHWPRDAISKTSDPVRALRTIVTEVEHCVDALSRDGEVCVALTAGHDTRFLLAACRSLLNSVSFVTVDAPGADLDVRRASEIAKAFSLRHVLLPYLEAGPGERLLWQRRVSHGLTGSNLAMHPSLKPLYGKIFVGGLGGEVGGGFLWMNSDERTPLNAQSIVSRLKLRQEPELVAAVDRWLQPLRHLDSLLLLDLAYIELRMSCWAFAQSYALPYFREFNPLVSRRVYEAMLSIPPGLRRNHGTVARAIELAWPELMSLPINRYGGWRDGLAMARKVISEPRRAIRKIRQLNDAGTTGT